MSSSQIKPEMIKVLDGNAIRATSIISKLKQQLEQLQKEHSEKQYDTEIAELEKENKNLELHVETLKEQLTKAEIKHGKQVVQPPVVSNVTESNLASGASHSMAQGELSSTPTAPQQQHAKPKKKGKKDESTKGSDASSSKSSGSSAPPAAAEQRIDVSRLLLKVGRIVSCEKHPDADTLYIEEVDVGEDQRRTVVSGLVKHVPIDQMRERCAVFLVNLKPAKMRGVLSQGMIMCASSPECVEVLEPPEGCQPGDAVHCLGYPHGVADEQLNPKRKIWEQVAPDLKVNEEGVATYKGAHMEVPGKGIVRAPTLTNVQIK